ncbi:LCP family protein [Collinsella intestinalis]|uniref:LCP family protein n=1 Tax=Collinsella intestinalis TaxID=147207 RepID=UPI0025A38D94|nr:LCP family protein [Collinsella intestinalis]MDM8163739.1 LCP family protein [Collinsella intestinalis]
MSMRKKPVQHTHRPTTGAASRIYSRENVGRYAERARQRRRGRVIRRGLLIGVLGVLLVGVVTAGAWVTSLMSRLNDGEVITSDLLATLTDSDVTREPFYMLLLGTDGRPGEETYRTDSIILARVDPTDKEVTLISIPRDTAYVYQGSTVKINAVFSYGGSDDMVQAVNDLCGVQISEYAEINFDGLKALVDAVGGIDIYVPEGDGVDDPEAGPVVIEPGQQHMDGEAALTFCRARHQFADGDYTRMRHQRMVLGALAEKILNNLDVTTVPALMNQLADMVKTSLNVTDIVSLINAMHGMDVDNMYSANLPSWAGEDTYINGQSFVFVDETALAEMMARVDAGEDPQGPQTMGTTGEGGGTVGDLYENSNEDWIYGTATTGFSDESSTEGSEGDTSTVQ